MIVSLEGVAKSFRVPRVGTVVALAEASLEVEAGSRVAILGPNGAGKTTLLRLAAGLLEPDRGRARIDVAPHDIRWIAPADFGLYGRLSPRGLLAWFAALDELAVPPIDDVLARSGLADYDRPIRTLSAGARARLSLARALLAPGRLWLLDEPTRSLDVDARASVRKTLDGAIGSDAAILVTHDLEEASALANRWRPLVGGRLGFERPVGPDLAEAYGAAMASAR